MTGLSEPEADRRLRRHGPNRLRETKPEPLWEELLEELAEPMILLLLGTGALYALWGEAGDALTILVVILALVAVEVVGERRAEGAVAALRRLAEPTAAVRRDGRVRETPREQVVPGDVVLLEAGRRIPADARLIAAHGLAVDESALTGESVPVEKETGALAFSGTLAVRGRGEAEVVATGDATELGRLAGRAREAKPPPSPLDRAMRELSRSLLAAAIAVSVAVPLIAWRLRAGPVRPLILTGLALAFATIPEEMPIILALTLALGARRLARQHAIVRRLDAVETLGTLTAIATDKTGTLTENRLEVARLLAPGGDARVLEAAALAAGSLDPSDDALRRAARTAGLDGDRREGASPRAEFPFDRTRRLSSVIIETAAGGRVVVKGAPEAVAARATAVLTSSGPEPLSGARRRELLAEAEALADEGLRVLAVAERRVGGESLERDEAESGLTWLGLIGLHDPPRPEARAALAACHAAGIRVLMVTGDHPKTAAAVARAVGLDSGKILIGEALDGLTDEELRETLAGAAAVARATPEHKLRIVTAWQAAGERVAVTGDGVNDAPALAAADVGVAMGRGGTDVAREASDVVLADDDFATIVRGVAEGRVLFTNLRKAVRYYLACKAALAALVLLSVLLGLSVPFAPVQIIVMELFMDLAASAAFVAEPGESGLMSGPPRDPRARFLDGAMVASIFTSAAGLFASVGAAYLWSWPHGEAHARTVAFVTWLLGHVALAFSLRRERERFTWRGLATNPVMVTWGLATAAFVLLAVRLPALRVALKTAPLTAVDWAGAALAVAGGVALVEWAKRHRRFDSPALAD
jgi:Ca2+-transporting ATPase